MTFPQLLFVCWCSGVLAVTSCIRVDGYSCVSAYWNMVTCVLNITDNPVGQSNTTYSLKFKDLLDSWKDPISCPLVVMNHSYSCVCKIKNDDDDDYLFMASDTYTINLCHESVCLPVIEMFLPSQHIQLTPPHKAEVQETPDTVNVTWKSGYESHRHLNDLLDYEILLQTSQSKDRTLHSNSYQFQGFISIARSELIPDATYCLKVRSNPKSEEGYSSIWSDWSTSTCWKNEAGEKQVNILVILIKSLGPVCVAVGVLLFVFYSPAARMKIKTLSHTPSPAPFFQPLFQHEGNLQEWFSPRGRFVLTYKTEEIWTTDDVIVVPTPITKDPEENQDLHNLPVTQLAFPQCQTSYVGLPGAHEAPPPLTLVCPGDMSYTQLPCSVWGVGIGEVEVPPPLLSSPPKDLLISREDSGCEDLTQSPECSVPNSPVDDSPPPCYGSDYCILNKTAEGFAPVLVSRGNNLNVQSDSLQEGES